MWRASSEHEAHTFPGAIAEWTADQRKIIALQRELAGLYQLCAVKEVPPPSDDVLADYRRIQDYRAQVMSGTVAKEQQHSHGFRLG
ncbi:hypothetical protein KQR54_18745 [Mycobacterium gordonae]|nr:hypothetical protein [Mycobacterium gordonae]